MVLGGLAAAVIALPIAGLPAPLVLLSMALAGMAAGGAWIGLVGWLKARRAVNETIASLLMAYIAMALFNHLVEGSLRDPSSLNKPSTYGIGDANMLGPVPGTELHPGLPVGIIACLVFWILIYRTSFGFACPGYRRQPARRPAPGPARGPPHRHRLRHGRCLRRACRHDRRRRRAWSCQRLARRRLRLCRHPHRLPRPPQPAGHPAHGLSDGRHRRRAAAFSSAAWACPTPPSSCSRA